MRIVSTVASATEILMALGLGEELVGVTYACGYIEGARDKPIVVKSKLDTEGMSSGEIDEAIKRYMERGESLYYVDEEVLREVKPDLIIGQGLCDVCAITPGSLEDQIKMVSPDARLISLEPTSIDDILRDIIRIGEVTGRSERAMQLVEDMRRRIERVRTASARLPRKRVFFMEWIDPPYCSGHWVPEMIEIAGGIDLGEKHNHSRRVTPREILRHSPEYVVAAPCGYSLERTVREAERLLEQGWVGETPAYASGEIYAVESKPFFSSHGPGIVDGIGIIAEILHPKEFGGLAPEGTFSRLC